MTESVVTGKKNKEPSMRCTQDNEDPLGVRVNEAWLLATSLESIVQAERETTFHKSFATWRRSVEL